MPEGSSILAFLGAIKTLKETLTLIIDAPNSLEKAELQYKIASITKTLSELEDQAQNFERVVKEKDEEILRLKNLLNKKTIPQTDELPKECFDTLKLFAQFSSLHPQEIAQNLNIHQQKAMLFLDKLKESQLISPYLDRLITRYKLTEKGRSFLYDKNWL